MCVCVSAFVSDKWEWGSGSGGLSNLNRTKITAGTPDHRHTNIHIGRRGFVGFAVDMC